MRVGISGTHGTGKTTLAEALCERLPPAEMPGLRSRMNDALLDLVYGDPLDAWEDIPVLDLNGPLDSRLDAVLAALDQL
jgi:hypothetical protein